MAPAEFKPEAEVREMACPHVQYNNTKNSACRGLEVDPFGICLYTKDIVSFSPIRKIR